jgi:pimeloyl-ACP methyl ester carboxylesterase
MCPYKSLQEAAIAIMGRLIGSLLIERFDNAEMLKSVKAPVFIIHGQKDTLIPFEHSEYLINLCKNSKGTFLVLPPEMTHNLFNAEDDLVTPLLSFLSHLGQHLIADKQHNRLI